MNDKKRSRVRTRKQFKKPNILRISNTMGKIDDKRNQIIHCVSQLRRFSHCFLENDLSNMLQFGYNLGRLQELCNESQYPEIWWNPIKKLIDQKQWGKLYKNIDLISSVLGVEYDESIIRKGC